MSRDAPRRTSRFAAEQPDTELGGVRLVEQRILSPIRVPRHSHPFAYAVLLMEGAYRGRYGNDEHVAGPGDAAFRPPGLPHDMEVGPEGARLFNVVFGPTWTARLDERSGIGPSGPDAGALAWIAVRLRAEARSPDRDSAWMVEDLVGQMLDQCAPARAPRIGAPPPAWLARLEMHVAADPAASWTLARAATLAGVHPVHVASSFRRFHRKTFGEHLRRARVRAASRALVREAESLAQIALASGFSDQSHFTHVFRRYAGLTPGRYRELMYAGGRRDRH